MKDKLSSADESVGGQAPGQLTIADQDTICILISWPPAAAAKPSITVQFSIAVTSTPKLGYKMRTFQLSDYYRLAFSHILYI